MEVLALEQIGAYIGALTHGAQQKTIAMHLSTQIKVPSNPFKNDSFSLLLVMTNQFSFKIFYT